jgi:hypothetical protein
MRPPRTSPCESDEATTDRVGPGGAERGNGALVVGDALRPRRTRRLPCLSTGTPYRSAQPLDNGYRAHESDSTDATSSRSSSTGRSCGGRGPTRASVASESSRVCVGTPSDVKSHRARRADGIARTALASKAFQNADQGRGEPVCAASPRPRSPDCNSREISATSVSTARSNQRRAMAS